MVGAGCRGAESVRTGYILIDIEAVQRLKTDRKLREALATSLHLARVEPKAMPRIKADLPALMDALCHRIPRLTPEEFAEMQPNIMEAAQSYEIAFAQVLLGDQLRRTAPESAFAWYCK